MYWAALCLASAAAFATGGAHAKTPEELCLELEAQAKAGADQAIEKIKKSEHYGDVQGDRRGALECQLAAAGELSSWVQGKVSMGFLDKLMDDVADYADKKACDEIKARARAANRDLEKITGRIEDLPTSLEEAQKRAQEYAEQAAREYAKEKIDEMMDKIPETPRAKTPDYDGWFGGNKPAADAWDAIRKINSNNGNGN